MDDDKGGEHSGKGDGNDGGGHADSWLVIKDEGITANEAYRVKLSILNFLSAEV